MATKHTIFQSIKIAGISGLLLVSGHTFASGFALIEQSVSSMGTGYANGSAGMDDASTIFFNPASMARLRGSNVAGGIHAVNSTVDVDAKAAYNSKNLAIAGSGLGGLPIMEKNGSTKSHTNTDLLAAVPHGGISHQLNDQMWLGLSINAPFGLKTKYDDSNWVGRYHAIKSELLTYNFNPAFAYRFNEHASMGFGLNALYADGKLTNAVDGGLAAALGGAPIPGWVPGSTTYDSKAKLSGDDWGYGYNFGVLLEPSDRTRLGVHFRSRINLTVKGDVRVTGPVVDFTEGAKLDLTLPGSVSISGLHAINDKITLMADVTWTEWSQLNQLRVDIDNGQKSITPLDWDDTVRVAVGASYRHNNSWLFRAGVALDETPVPKDNLRTPRVPDDERVWLTFGVNYQLSKALTFDAGYAHLFVEDPNIKNTADAHDPSLPYPAGLTGFHSLNADYDAQVDIFSAQVNWKFM